MHWMLVEISHRLDEIFTLCDQVTILRDGKIIDTRPVAEVTREKLVSMMVGRSIDSEFPPRSNNIGNVLLEVKNLSTRKIHDVSFQVHTGEILGLVGLVGAGRTEIVRALFGADPKENGHIFMDGKEVRINSPIDAQKAGIGFVTEDRKQQGLFLKFSVEDNIIAAAIRLLSPHGFVNRKRCDSVAQKYISDLKIRTPKASTKVLSLSGGNQQKCIIGRWLEVKPRLLILDEPTRGIDVGAKYEIYLLIQRLAEEGNAILLISSELPEVMNLSNRCLTVSNGRVVGEFNPAIDSAETIMQSVLE